MATHRAILLVEDEAAIADLLRRVLVRADYTVSIATDGWQALAALDAERPAVLILDLVLPGVSGFSILEHLRQQQLHVPVIVITANPFHRDAVHHADIVQVLLKPFFLEELLAALHAIYAYEQRV